jgi:hypothetical protein
MFAYTRYLHRRSSSPLNSRIQQIFKSSFSYLIGLKHNEGKKKTNHLVLLRFLKLFASLKHLVSYKRYFKRVDQLTIVHKSVI